MTVPQLQPMLAESGDAQYLDRPDYLYEEKLDGIRCLAWLNPMLDKTQLVSRSGKDITVKFPELATLHSHVKVPVVVDGEIVGSDFNSVQHRISQQSALGIRMAAARHPVAYHVFDIIQRDYNSIATLPLIERKAVLSKAFAECFYARLVPWEIGDGKRLLARTQAEQLEGIMAKEIYSPYVHKRSTAWLKIKNFKEADFYVCGMTVGENDRQSTFGSLILGKHKEGRLVYVGNVGSGFTRAQLEAFTALFTHVLVGVESHECPFETRPDTDRPVKMWLKPNLRIEVRYLEQTKDGMLRFPTFRRLVK